MYDKEHDPRDFGTELQHRRDDWTKPTPQPNQDVELNELLEKVRTDPRMPPDLFATVL